MANRFGTARILGNPAAEITPQERVNLEMLKAVESLGRRLAQTEFERDRLANRLSVIESAATIDEKTGKLYLPVVVDPNSALPPVATVPHWAVGISLASSVVALFALGLSLYHTPEGPQLTARQLAALNALAAPLQMADSAVGGWKRVDEAEGLEPKTEEAKPAAAAAAALPAETYASPAPEPVRTAELPSHLWSETFGPPAPPVAEASAGWHLAEKSKDDEPAPKAVKPAPVEQAAVAPAPEKHAAPEMVEEVPPPKLAEVETPKVEIIKVTPPKEAAAAQAALEPAAGASPEKKEEPKVSGGQIGPDPALSPQLAELEKKAFAGAPEAQHDLATIYASGKSVAQDYKRAAYWFYKAADGGVANADYNLGVMFQQGMGVRKDVNKALGWYEKAAQLGHPEAMYNLGIAYVEGVGTERNIDRGVAYFKKAANAGVAQAAYNLGVLYESNFVGPINLAKAAEWYQVAADEGHQSAKDAVSRLKQQIAVSTKTGDQGAKVAASVEPASGTKSDEEMGEGDASPVDPKTALLSKIQSALIAHGDLTGKPTGVLDDKTAQVIRSWQNRLGLPITGEPTQELLEKVRDAK